MTSYGKKHIVRTALTLLFALAACLTSCGGGPELQKSGGDDPDPDNPGQMSREVSIAYLKSLYTATTVTVSEEIRISGQVISTDRQGAFYQSLCIEDASGGIVVMVEGSELFKRFPYGSTVSVSCNSLRLGTYGGLLRLGSFSDDPAYTVAPLPASNLPAVITVTPDQASLPMPTFLSIGGISPDMLSRYVAFDDVQFVGAEAETAWCDTDPETGELLDTDRHIIDRAGNTLAVHISRHALFAEHAMPRGSGMVRGILGYFGSSYQLILFDSTERDMRGERF